MVRRLFSYVVIASFAGTGALLAAERATLILTDGERMSGTVVVRGGYGDRDNPNRGDLNLLTDDGRRVPIHLEQVAVIQFGAGRPSPAELDALSDDVNQMIVLRNGSVEVGRLVTLAGGDVIRWQRRNGRVATIPFRDLTRVYVDAGRARTAFNYTDRPRRGRDIDPRFGDREGNDPRLGTRDGNDPRFGNRDGNDPRSGNRNDADTRGRGDRNSANADNRNARGGSSSGSVRVEGNQAWTNTGVNVRAGDMVAFRATGTITFAQGATGTSAGPDGNDKQRSPTYPVGAMPLGGLIGRVGNSAPFPIGSNTQPIRMPGNGTLQLGVNDNNVGDNGGFFTVEVSAR